MGQTSILALASTKGGVGKTTLAFCLATDLARRTFGQSESRKSDSSVHCIDADPNATLYRSVQKGQPEGVSASIANSESLLDEIAAAAKRARFVVIDLEGSSNEAMIYACGRAHLVLIPSQPSEYDVVEALKTHSVVKRASELTGRTIVSRAVLSRTPVLKQRVVAHSRQQFESYGLTLLETELMERAAFRLMTFTGKPPVGEDPKGGAALNVAALVDEVVALLQVPA